VLRVHLRHLPVSLLACVCNEAEVKGYAGDVWVRTYQHILPQGRNRRAGSTEHPGHAIILPSSGLKQDHQQRNPKTIKLAALFALHIVGYTPHIC
jgi:hypothetical protein